MENLYLENGYVDMAGIIARPLTFQFTTGGRGTGKTYGVLDYLVHHDMTFMYLRRTEVESEMIGSDVSNPFNVIEDNIFKFGKGNKLLKTFVDDAARTRGYLCALSTFYKVRGVPFDKVDIIFYDEFITESRTRKLKDEFNAFNNMYETINRNRELQGKEPVKVICCSNAENISNPIYMGLGIINNIMKMQKNGEAFYVDKNRSLGIYMLNDSPISKAKRETALYKLNKDNRFTDMALNNSFLYDDRLVKSISLSGYVPVVQVGELLIYRHKTNYKYYVKVGNNNGVAQYLATDDDLKRFQTQCNTIYRAFINRKILFETMEAQSIFIMYWN